MPDQPMRVRDLIRELLDEPMDAMVYVGKGCGPLARVEYTVTDRIVVVLEPVKPVRDGD